MADVPTLTRQLDQARAHGRDLAKKLRDRDETIRVLQERLRMLDGVGGILPAEYVLEVVTLAGMAYHGQHRGDIANVETGKPHSTGTRLPNRALAALEKELRYLQRRAARDAVSGAARGALAHAVDHLEEGAAA